MKRPEQQLIDASVSSVIEYIEHLERVVNSLGSTTAKQELATVAAVYILDGLQRYYDEKMAKEQAAVEDLSSRLGEDDDVVLQYQGAVAAVQETMNDTTAFLNGFITGKVEFLPENDPRTSLSLLRDAIQRCEESTGHLVRFEGTPVTGAVIDQGPDGSHVRLVEE